MLHIFKCLFGSCVRTLNWLLLANVLITAVRVLMGGVTSYMACADVLASQPTWATFKVGIFVFCPAHHVGRDSISSNHHNAFLLQVKAVPDLAVTDV